MAIDAFTEMMCRETGPRQSGSEGMAKARKILAERLGELGAVNITEEKVAVGVWTPGKPYINSADRTYGERDCPQCPGSSPGTVSAAIVDRISAPDADVSGKIALIGGNDPEGGVYMPLTVRIKRLEQAGAAAVIVRSENSLELPAVQIVASAKPVGIPVLSVSSVHAKEFAHHAAQGAQILLSADGQSHDGFCANLVADLGPDDLPEEMIVFGAHLDSFFNAPGAFDNMSGVSGVVRILEMLAPARKSFKRKLRIIFYTAEELMLLGSKIYVRAHVDELDDVRLVVNFDSIFPSTSRGIAVMSSPALKDFIDSSLAGNGIKAEARNMFCMSSDYLSFVLEGIPAIRPADFEDSFPEWSHTELDVAENIPAEWIEMNARVFAPLMKNMLTVGELPCVRRLSRQEVLTIVDEKGAKMALEAMGYDI